MESLQAVIGRINGQMKKSKQQVSFRCNKCKDTKILTKTIKKRGLEYQVAIPCECQSKDERVEKISRSGLDGVLGKKTLQNYQATEPHQQIIKSKAIEYLNETRKGNYHSFALLGQSGVGKTHVMVAVAAELLKANVEVKYFTADEIIQRLQASKFDEENYNREFHKIARAKVLFIDELFKSSITNYYGQEGINNNDFREIFKIVNYRYNKNMPILLNSEIHFERFAELDQAMIGRINEMCARKYIVSVKPDRAKNYRLKSI